mmetsp:Transcript_6041/g.10584  ORF Transcript_6041/g.10584 Transcript_6041/m.10584 type:complete len:252 (-) Transcript_6041:224-979(-)
MQPVPAERLINRMTEHLISARDLFVTFIRSLQDCSCGCCRSRIHRGGSPAESFLSSPVSYKQLADPPGSQGSILGLDGKKIRPDSPEMLAVVAEAYNKKLEALGQPSAKLDSVEDQPECVICLELFDKGNPEMHTLCSCGANRTSFHYACLLQWTEDHDYCPACRGRLYYEEMAIMEEARESLRSLQDADADKNEPVGNVRLWPEENTSSPQPSSRSAAGNINATSIRPEEESRPSGPVSRRTSLSSSAVG